MAVSLQKGQKISLTKESAGLDSIMIGLGWDAEAKKGGFFSPKVDIDCDASVFLLQQDKLCHKDDIVYYANLRHKSNSVFHQGDNLTGDGDGDDEQIMINLSAVPAVYNRIVVVVNIYSAVQRKQHFGMVKNAFCRIVDNRNHNELCRYNLSEDYQGMYAMIFGEVYRQGDEWKFNAVGQGTNDPSLAELSRRYS